MSWRLLGDQALLTYCAQEGAAVDLAQAVRSAAPDGLLDVVQAYSSVAVFFDLRKTDVTQILEHLNRLPSGVCQNAERRRRRIPLCYEMGLDLGRISKQTGLAEDQIIELYQGQIYSVYAIGFCPGFPYLGYLAAPLQGVPRLESPRLKVDVGSVGLTGRQTGIYTEERPGGWNIVGRTPLELVHVADGYFPLRTGDEVEFQRIDAKEFGELKGERM